MHLQVRQLTERARFVPSSSSCLLAAQWDPHSICAVSIQKDHSCRYNQPEQQIVRAVNIAVIANILPDRVDRIEGQDEFSELFTIWQSAIVAPCARGFQRDPLEVYRTPSPV